VPPFTAIAVRSASSSLDWVVARPFRVRSSVSAWRWTETGRAGQTFLGGTLDAELKLGLTAAQIRYDYNAWRETFENTESRLFVRLVRSF
jgi:hypothetical protein